ncbi:MAG: type II toxin-antitoxin system PemK/MazF family toxin [Phycisphaerales bacterium]|nr:MAG: type II toxin-antitoxin system PemK/MazF family toxin [Phycisphaerales bacterium]
MVQGAWSPSRGQIVRAAVQYSDSEQTKTRFPVVVSSDAFNERYPDVIVAFTTKASNVKHPRNYDVEVSERRSDFRATGLTVSTTVRCGRLWSIDKRKIMDVVGALPEDVLADVRRLVRACFVDD